MIQTFYIYSKYKKIFSPAVKSTPVSVIQPPSAISPAKVNGTSTEAEPVTPAEAEQPAVNGVGANKPAEV